MKFILMFVLNMLLLVNISAKELNLEVIHEEDPSDRVTNEEESEGNLLPSLIGNKPKKNVSIKGDVLVVEEFAETREIDGAEVKVKVNTD